jgi:ADP-heptose:LPS heptosyltransferase
MEGQTAPLHPPRVPLAFQPAPLLRHDVRSIVVFRALQVGDMLCAVPALRALRASCPLAHITLVSLPWARQFAGRFPDLLDDFVAFPGHPGMAEQAVQVAQLAPFYASMRAQQFDLAIQLHGCGPLSNEVVAQFGAAVQAGFVKSSCSAFAHEPWFMPFPDSGPEPLRLLSLMQHLGAAPSFDARLAFPVTVADDAELAASGLTHGLSPGAFVCIHAGARLSNKCWPLDCFAHVAESLAAQWALDIVLTGSPAEHALAAELARRIRRPVRNAATSLSLGAMAALMQRARLLVCNDTGVSHIAAGLGLPSVVVFSTADMERWSPQGQLRHRCIWDPRGERAALVLAQANALLSEGVINSSASAWT